MKDVSDNKSITIQELNTPKAFAQKYLSTYHSFDYRPNEPMLIYNTKTAWYFSVTVTAYMKTLDIRKVIGCLIVKDPNKSNKFEVVYEVFERGFNLKTKD